MKRVKSDCVATAEAAIKLLKSGLAKSDAKDKSRCLFKVYDLVESEEFKWVEVPDELIEEFEGLFVELYEEVASGVSER